MFKRGSCFGLRRFTPGWVIRRFSCGVLLIALGCSRSTVEEKSASQAASDSSAAPVEQTAVVNHERPTPSVQAGATSEPASPAPSPFPSDIPIYPDGSVTKVDAGPDGPILLLDTRSTWEHLRDFYASSLLPAGWNAVPAEVPGQNLARFEKDGRTLVVQMQPGRQEQMLVRISYTTNSLPRQ